MKLAEEGDTGEVLARGHDGVADVLSYQAGAADYEDIFGGGHGWWRGVGLGVCRESGMRLRGGRAVTRY